MKQKIARFVRINKNDLENIIFWQGLLSVMGIASLLSGKFYAGALFCLLTPLIIAGVAISSTATKNINKVLERIAKWE